jgi:hypothetical protein
MADASTSADVRASLIDALRLDLIGPRPDHPPHALYERELLPIAPSQWYLTGFLAPFEGAIEDRSDFEADEELDSQERHADGDDDGEPEGGPARRAWFPSSMGLSFLVAKGTDRVRVRVAWGDYQPVELEKLDDEQEARLGEVAPEQRGGGGRWKRSPMADELDVELREGTSNPIPLPNHADLRLVVSVRTVRSLQESALVPEGSKAVSLFLVNHQKLAPDVQRDAAYIFQPELSVRSEAALQRRPDLHGRDSDDWDDKVADLQYRDAVEYAVGHNVSAVADVDEDGQCHTVRTAWMPTADVLKVKPRKLPVDLGMEDLADAADADAVRAIIAPMVTEYASWLAQQRGQLPAHDKRRALAAQLLDNAERARQRILAGLAALDDPKVLEAFQLSNRAIAMAIRQRICHDRDDKTPEEVDQPKWRPFQLAFIVMNLCGTADGKHPDRSTVDLLFFPTGGGKTEAYLGLASFALFLRRLRDPSIRSAGVTVLMRYTLRLLTLDQLGRAATLICAMEKLRQADVEKLGPWPFEIGLWVGQSATPNRMGRKGENNSYTARSRTIAYLNDTGRKPSPIPLENCPWCGWKFSKNSFKLLPNNDVPTDLRVACIHRKCEFHVRSKGAGRGKGLPILAVDEPIYRRLPCFIIATVDKFANVPWVGEAGGLFGRVDRYDDDGFYGPASPGKGRALGGQLPPPSLIIQDELHLISGPLGTMVGLYETAIDALASDQLGGDSPRPKIVASTATVRRAERQIRGLFGRDAVEVFPPPGPDRRDSFFAITVSQKEANPRTYVGVAAQGRNLKVVLLRTLLALMASAQRQWKDAGGDKADKNPADPYMTVLGYFNSLRELGGSRRIVEDEVSARLRDYAWRRQRPGIPNELFENRPRVLEPRELTSRVSTNDVADTKRRLALSHSDKDHLDVALATNMISVGLDITRLGLMVVLGQPKSASEYIQSTSRVGRDDERPGLVVTLLNLHRPRDRSHYERFAAWHESFYRAVEATSVTPFSPRAIDRGLAGVTVALARHGLPQMTAPRGAMEIAKHRSDLDFVARILSERAAGHDKELGNTESEALRTKVRDRVYGLLDAWERVLEHKQSLQYQREVGGAVPPLLHDPLSKELARETRDAQMFKAGRSLRDVEPTVNLWLRTPEQTDDQEYGR